MVLSTTQYPRNPEGAPTKIVRTGWAGPKRKNTDQRNNPNKAEPNLYISQANLGTKKLDNAKSEQCRVYWQDFFA